MISLLALFSVLLFSDLCFTLPHQKRSSEELITLFSRFAFLSFDQNLGTNYTPPTPAQIAASVTDINHTAMLASGLYTQSQIDVFRLESIVYFNTLFGINFSAGTLLPSGIIVSPPFVMIPFATGAANSFRVAFDSDHVAHGITADWYAVQYGEVIISQGSGLFLGGTHGGEAYVVGDVLTYIRLNFQKLEGISPLHQHEEFTLRSPWVSKNILNSQGYVDSLSKLEIVDSNGNVGFFTENIMFVKNVDTGFVYEKIRVTATWT
jgi:hypothetical protein